MNSERIGSSFQSFLEEEGVRDEVTSAAQERVSAWEARSGAGDDPSLRAFLALIDRDVAENPESIQRISAELLSRVARFTEGVEMDVEMKLD